MISDGVRNHLRDDLLEPGLERAEQRSDSHRIPERQKILRGGANEAAWEAFLELEGIYNQLACLIAREAYWLGLQHGAAGITLVELMREENEQTKGGENG